MVSGIQTIDTSHEDMIHDAQLDYYGTTLATASSDNSIKIFDIRNKKQILIAHLREHQGPVWGLSWSHPMFGNLLASCSYDRKVIIWREINSRWEKIYEYTEHTSSVNSVCWAPHSYGLMLACGSSDGVISVLCMDVGTSTWRASKIPDAHAIGVNSVSWSPSVNADFMLNPAAAIKTVSPLVKRLVSGGCDSLIKIWRETGSQWIEEARLEGHSNWVRDVAWSPCLDLNRSLIASCGQDGRLIVWESWNQHNTDQDGASINPVTAAAAAVVVTNTTTTTATNADRSKPDQTHFWQPTVLNTYSDVVWHVSWSLTGNVLAVSGADNKVTLWKENLEGNWIALSEIDRSNQVAAPTMIDSGSLVGTGHAGGTGTVDSVLGAVDDTASQLSSQSANCLVAN